MKVHVMVFVVESIILLDLFRCYVELCCDNDVEII